MSYSDVQKAQACELVRQNKGVIDEILVGIIRDTLAEPKLPKMTIYRWWKQYEQLSANPAPEPDVSDKNIGIVTNNIIDVTTVKLDDKLELAAHKFINHALRDELLMWTSSKDAMTAAAIAIDKMRLLRDLPTEIIGSARELTELAAFFRENNIEMSTAIREWRERLQARKSAQGKVSNG